MHSASTSIIKLKKNAPNYVYSLQFDRKHADSLEIETHTSLGTKQFIRQTQLETKNLPSRAFLPATISIYRLEPNRLPQLEDDTR